MPIHLAGILQQQTLGGGGGGQSFVAAGTADYSASSTTLELSMPAGIQADDLLLAVVQNAQQNTTWADTDSFGTEYVDTGGAAGSDNTLAVYWRVATGSEASSYTFTTASGGTVGGLVLAWRGFDTTSPVIDASANAHRSAFLDGNTQANYTGTLPTMAADDWLVSIVGSRSHRDGGTTTAPTGHTSRYGALVGTNCAIDVADHEAANNPAAADWSTTGTTNTANRGIFVPVILNVS